MNERTNVWNKNKREERRERKRALVFAQKRKKINHVLFNVKNKENEQKRITAIGSM